MTSDRFRPLRGSATRSLLVAGLIVGLTGPAGRAALAGGADLAGPAPVRLTLAAPFSVLAGSTVTNTGPTVVTRDLGVSPGTAVTGFPPGIVTRDIHAADATAAAAKTALAAAYNDAAGRAGGVLVAGDLGGRTLTPGVYRSASSLGITGELILDGLGDPDAVFIIQMGSTLTTAAASTVVLTNGVRARNVFWQVGSSATLGTDSVLRGTILALASITVTSGVRVIGRALALNGAVTLDSNVLTRR